MLVSFTMRRRVYKKKKKNKANKHQNQTKDSSNKFNSLKSMDDTRLAGQ